MGDEDASKIEEREPEGGEWGRFGEIRSHKLIKRNDEGRE